jgi:hypothetical protein
MISKNENPGDLFCSPGFGTFCLTLSSGRPIGEPRRNNRYRDNKAYYNDVENEPADAQSRLTARSRKIKRELETTIGHLIFNLKKWPAISRPGQYRPSSSISST